jgi:uncharacterized membrane protein
MICPMFGIIYLGFHLSISLCCCFRSVVMPFMKSCTNNNTEYEALLFVLEFLFMYVLHILSLMVIFVVSSEKNIQGLPMF